MQEACRGVVSVFDIAAARENLRKRQVAQRQSLAIMVGQARIDAERIVAMLIQNYRPQRIHQWGSLLRPERFREWSDIDIALEGLVDPLDGLRALDVASTLTQFPVDIVELERIHPAHAKTIREEGRMVYERPN